MSVRVDTSSLIAGSCVVGNRGLGVLGAVIRATTSTGSAGAGYLYNDLTIIDDDKEIRGLLLTVPSDGLFVANEDGSFTLTGAVDGDYTFTYRLYEDGVDKGVVSPPSTITIGTIIPPVFTVGGGMLTDKYNKLRSLGYTGTLQEMFLDFLLARGAVSRNLNQAQKEFLVSQGVAVSQIDVMWYKYFTSLGYPGARPNKEALYWVNVV